MYKYILYFHTFSSTYPFRTCLCNVYTRYIHQMYKLICLCTCSRKQKVDLGGNLTQDLILESSTELAATIQHHGIHLVLLPGGWWRRLAQDQPPPPPLPWLSLNIADLKISCKLETGPPQCCWPWRRGCGSTLRPNGGTASNLKGGCCAVDTLPSQWQTYYATTR